MGVAESSVTRSPSGEFEIELELLDAGRSRFRAIVRRVDDQSTVIELRRAVHGFPFIWSSVNGRDVLVCSVDYGALAFVDPYSATVTTSAVLSQPATEGFIPFYFYDAGDGALLGIGGAMRASPGQLVLVETDFGRNPALDRLLLSDFDLCEFEGWSDSRRCVWTRKPDPDSLLVWSGRVERPDAPWIEEDEATERVVWTDRLEEGAPSVGPESGVGS